MTHAPFRNGGPPARLSELLRIVVGGNTGEARALELAEEDAYAAYGRHGLIWMVEDDDEDAMPRAVDALADRIEAGDGGRYRADKEALDACATLSPERVADLALNVYCCQLRAAYYLGLARGWLAAWRVGGAR
jgi:hypothetical protein